MKTTVNDIFAQQEALSRAALAAGARETRARIEWRQHVQNSDFSEEAYALSALLRAKLKSARIEAAEAWGAYNRFVEAAVAALSEQQFDCAGYVLGVPHVEQVPFHGAVDCPESSHG